MALHDLLHLVGLRLPHHRHLLGAEGGGGGEGGSEGFQVLKGLS